MLKLAVLVVVFATFVASTEGWFLSGHSHHSHHSHDEHEETHDEHVDSHEDSHNETHDDHDEDHHEESQVSTPSPDQNVSKPYYFGSTGLTCLLVHHMLHKRSANAHEVYTWSYSHSFLYYDNFHFELGKDSHVYYDSELPTDDLCHSTVGMAPTGYSTLDVGCIKNCSDNYIAHYGSYNFFNNNCHLFVNRMAKILDDNHCPDWCDN